MKQAKNSCLTSPSGIHEISPVIIGEFPLGVGQGTVGFLHYQCKWCGNTSYLKLDGEFAWEGFQGLEPSVERLKGTK
jgi:hypothetical protein